MMIAVYLLQNTGSYGYVFWLPSALKASAMAVGTALTNFEIGVLNAVPYVITAIGMVLISRHSDKHRERRLHVALALAFGGVLLMRAYSAAVPLVSSFLYLFCRRWAFGSLGPSGPSPRKRCPAVVGSAMGLCKCDRI
jgi:hypothetical protein